MNQAVPRLLRVVSRRPLASHHHREFIASGCPRISQSFRLTSTMGVDSKMVRSNRLKQVFDQTQRSAMGLWQMLPGANISRILARSGADFVMVDCEHGNIDGTV